MVFSNHLFYRLWILTNPTLRLLRWCCLDWSGWGRRSVRQAEKKNSIAGNRHKQGENRPDIGTRSSH